MSSDQRAELARVEAERLNLANLITHYWIPRAEHLQAEVRRLTAALQRRTAETVVAQDAWSVVFEALCDSYDPYAEDGFSVTTGTEAVLDALRRAGLLIDGDGCAD